MRFFNINIMKLGFIVVHKIKQSGTFNNLHNLNI